MKLKLNFDDIIKINYFEKVTRLKTKDYFYDDKQDKMVFVVQPYEIGKLLKDRNGIAVIKDLEKKFGKRLRIIEYNEDPALFIKNAILPLKVEEVVLVDKTVYLRSSDRSVKSIIIGTNAVNLNSLKNLVARYFDNIDIKVE